MFVNTGPTETKIRSNPITRQLMIEYTKMGYFSNKSLLIKAMKKFPDIIVRAT